MNPRKHEVVVNALKRKGVEVSNTDHIKLHYITTAGKKTTVWTKASLRDMGTGFLSQYQL